MLTVCSNSLTGVFAVKLMVTIDRDEDGMWVVECPSIPGCVSQGATTEEAFANVLDAIEACLDVRSERSEPLIVEMQHVEVVARCGETNTTAATSILDEIRRAFRDVECPEHFTNHSHCSECAAHDEILRSHTPETIGFEELGNWGCDPLCFINVAGFLYYMPGLARLALMPQKLVWRSDAGGARWHHYLDLFLLHLREERMAAFDERQRSATLHLLDFIRAQIDIDIGQGIEPTTYSVDCYEDLEDRIRTLRKTGHPSPQMAR
jgi:predicted RNase H-like HicB family nuclease